MDSEAAEVEGQMVYPEATGVQRVVYPGARSRARYFDLIEDQNVRPNSSRHGLVSFCKVRLILYEPFFPWLPWLSCFLV